MSPDEASGTYSDSSREDCCIPIKDVPEVSHIQTGNSIVLEFVAGWLPNVQVVSNDIHIYIPKGGAVLGILGALLYFAVLNGTELLNKLLELDEKWEQRKTRKEQKVQKDTNVPKELSYLQEVVRGDASTEALESALRTFLQQTNMHPDVRDIKIVRAGEPSLLVTPRIEQAPLANDEKHVSERVVELRRELKRLEEEYSALRPTRRTHTDD